MNLIVIADRRWGIGKDGRQPFFLKEDLRRFRELTLGGCVIMGRRTLEGLPGGRPLSGRRNLVLSRTPGLFPRGGGLRSPEQARRWPGRRPSSSAGPELYRAMLPWCVQAYVTRVEEAFPADCWMVDLDRAPEWRLAERSRSHTGARTALPFCTVCKGMKRGRRDIPAAQTGLTGKDCFLPAKYGTMEPSITRGKKVGAWLWRNARR